jgi:hypothetical protein
MTVWDAPRARASRRTGEWFETDALVDLGKLINCHRGGHCTPPIIGTPTLKAEPRLNHHSGFSRSLELLIRLPESAFLVVPFMNAARVSRVMSGGDVDCLTVADRWITGGKFKMQSHFTINKEIARGNHRCKIDYTGVLAKHNRAPTAWKDWWT